VNYYRLIHTTGTFKLQKRRHDYSSGASMEFAVNAKNY